MGNIHNTDGFFKRFNHQQVDYINMPVGGDKWQSFSLSHSLNQFIWNTDLFGNKTSSL